MKHGFRCSRLFFALACASAYTLCANLPYYRMLFFGNGIVCAKAVLLSFVYACAISYGLSLIGRMGRVLLVFLAVTSGIVLYFSLMYGFVQNKEMFALLWNTNPHEALGVFSPKILLFAGGGGLSGWLAARNMPEGRPVLRDAAELTALIAICVMVRPLLPVELKGRHPMPLGYLSHFGHAAKQQWRMRDMIAARKGLPGSVQRKAGEADPLYVILALGESLRADHLGIYGYGRNTTPRSEKLPLLVFEKCYSAGSGTTESVTRMLTRATIACPEAALTEQSVISLFRRAGFRTVWLTNQGSMATGETWVASIAKECELFRTHPSVYTMEGKLQDADLLPMLDTVLTMPAQNTLIVLHSFGSHLNPEDRYADIFRIFSPVCDKFSVADCTDGELVNSYDNSVLATDAYWAELTDRLKGLNALLLITSDHGDRLRGKYRGHSPELMDNPALRWIPFMLYASPSIRQDALLSGRLEHAKALQNQPISHDMLFHSLLGFAGIRTPAYQEELDMFSGKARAHQDPFVTITGIDQTSPL